MSKAIFQKLHPHNLKQLKAAIRAFGTVWFHGDGNIYTSQKESDDRSIFYNAHPANECAAYRAIFDKTSKVPESLEDMEDVLVEAYNQENEAKTKDALATSANGINYTMDEEDAATEEVTTGDAAPAAKVTKKGGQAAATKAKLDAATKPEAGTDVTGAPEKGPKTIPQE